MENFLKDYKDLSKNELINHLNENNSFESINRLASIICETEVSLVNMLDDNFQFTVSNFGDWTGFVTEKQETACQLTVQQDDILVINDTREDKRTKDIKGLTSDDSIRFYAGVPIKFNNKNLGALCVVDYMPKNISEVQKKALKDLAKEVELRVSLFHKKYILEQNNKKLTQASVFLKNSTDLLWIINPKDLTIVNSYGASKTLNVKDSVIVGERFINLIDEVGLERHIKNWLKKPTTKIKLPVKLNLELDREIWVNISFTKYDGLIYATAKDITKEHEAEMKMREALDEKEILLREVHHRVKNNLAVISGLLNLERMNTKHEEVERILLNSETRIGAIADIHEHLYKAKNFKNVNIKDYIESIVDHTLKIHGNKQKNIKWDVIVQDVSVNVNQALPMGLIINELITNSYIHAFKDKYDGIITVLIKEPEKNLLHFEVGDNGIGLDVDPNNLIEFGNLGFTLIDTLKKQLKADLEIKNEQGTKFIFTFESRHKKGIVSSMG